MSESRVTQALSAKAFTSLTQSINNRPALNAIVSKFSKISAEAAAKRKRIILLNLDDPDDVAFWQILENDTERFSGINHKEVHQRGEYLIRVIFYEHGEDLPLVKKKTEFISEYVPDAQY